MIVRNWMQFNPILIPSDTPLQEAKRLLSENNLHALAVVDEGRLRGLITRAQCMRAAHFVARTQNPDEYTFFANRLMVKDIMVRRPATVQSTDTMEFCMQKGEELGVAQFPVMEDDRVVGIISANEIFQLTARLLGAWEERSGVTLAAMEMCANTIRRIAEVVEGVGAQVQAIYPIAKAEPPEYKEKKEKKIIVRFHADDMDGVVSALEGAGFQVLESVTAPCRTAVN